MERKLPSYRTVEAPILHILSFTPSDPQLCFCLVELELENYGTTSDVSRFRWVTGSLLPNVTLQVRDIIVFSLEYKSLKETALARTVPLKVITSGSCFKESISGIASPWN